MFFTSGCLAFIFFLFILVLAPFIFTHVLASSFVRLGFTPFTAISVVLLVFVTSPINIPLKRWPRPPSFKEIYWEFLGFRFPVQKISPAETVLAVNVGGALIPLAISLYQILRLAVFYPVGYFLAFLLILAINTFVSWRFSRPMKGLGIGLPLFLPALTVSGLSLLLVPAAGPIVAFSAGVIGVVLGADILHLKDIKGWSVPMISIGGAGTFDGIFLCGVFSVLLAG